MEGLKVAYLDVTWEEHLNLKVKEGKESYDFIDLADSEVASLRAREEPDVGFWFDPNYVAPAVDPDAEAPEYMPIA